MKPRACAIMLLAANLASPAADSSVSGTVTDSLGKPVSGAIVTLESMDVDRSFASTTGSAGQFRLGAAREGRYSLRADARGYLFTELPRRVRRQDRRDPIAESIHNAASITLPANRSGASVIAVWPWPSSVTSLQPGIVFATKSEPSSR